jgi:hypothetical protein
MLNPFVLLSARLLQSLIASGNIYFVRQTYKRGWDALDRDMKGAFLFTHYNNANRAQVHFEALQHDGNRFLYNDSIPEHHEKLEIAAKQPLGYRVYTSLLEEPWKPSAEMAEKIRRYIGDNLTWTPARSDVIGAELFTQFGELFINLKYSAHEVKVPLSDIEKYEFIKINDIE